MSGLVQYLDRKLYPAYERNWDDALFRERILARITPRSVVLDLGAGAGIVREMNFRGLAQRVCGVDLDPRVETNPMLDEGKVSDAGYIPYDAEMFDLVFADNVMEHLADPDAVLTEIKRVLKPGGYFLFKTPNRMHYMPIIARLTPHRFHQVLNRLRGRAESDTFPTLYRGNTRATVERLAARQGFDVSFIDRIEGRPEYLRISWPTYLVGAAYERIVNSSEWLSTFRILLIAELRQPQG
ncbi:MAG: class I SAM-dependent methyltransferase [Burkholderiaceae bacterium]|nr:class I SAM-dependent methyltransferase [Burkholderiaceae bacterium]